MTVGDWNLNANTEKPKTTKRELLRDAYVEFLRNQFHQYRHPVAITLTFKQSIRHYKKSGQKKQFSLIHDRLDKYAASKAVREFVKRLSRRVLRRKEFDQGARIPSFAVMETSAGSARGRLHYHLTVDLAGKPVSADEIRAIWSRVKFAHREVDVQPSCNEGWISYSVKNIETSCHEVELDLDNCVPPNQVCDAKTITA